MSILFKGYEMEWSTMNNVRIERGPFMESKFSNWLLSFDSDPYAGTGNSYTHPGTQTGPVVSVPESENITNTYQCPSNNNHEMAKKKKISSEQLASLEQRFREDIKLDLDRKLMISKELGLQPRQVSVWFQNRRARWKVKHLEESYDLLRQEYDAVWREKQMLHDEVKKLKDIILRNQDFMMTQSNQDNHQMNSIGEYNSPMMVASSCWPPQI